MSAVLVALALLVAAPAAGVSPPSDLSAGGRSPAVRWEPSLAGRSRLTAVALQPDSGRVVAGDERGVLLRSEGSAPEAHATRAPVVALAFTEGGSLLIGTTDGLYVLATDGQLRDVSPGVGERARSIRRIAVAGVHAAVATGAGVFVASSEPGTSAIAGFAWLRAPGPSDAVSVAIASVGARGALFALGEGDVFLGPLPQSGQLPEPLLRVPSVEASLRASAVDLFAAADGSVLLVTSDRILVFDADGDTGRTFRPALPPGAVVRRVAIAAGVPWLATDRGLLLAPSLEGPWTRALTGAALAPVHDVASDGTSVAAATDAGLLLAGPGPVPDDPLREARIALEFPGRAEPPVEAVFRAALAYLDLGPEGIRALQRGLAIRGFLPELALRFDRGRSAAFDDGFDESFVSGGLRHLRDRSRGSEQESSATVELAWTLGELAYSDDAVEISREARAVVQLRDDVLDEIAQLYFERRRVLLDLAALGPAEFGSEAMRLRLRAEELAAGLDGWTGGWFGRAVATAR